jgi:hypothetical protein
MRDSERNVVELAVAAVAEQAAKADALIDELQAAGLPEDGPVLQAKLLRLELLKVKGDLGRELGRWVLDCRLCNRWGSHHPRVLDRPGLGVRTAMPRSRVMERRGGLPRRDVGTCELSPS